MGKKIFKGYSDLIHWLKIKQVDKDKKDIIIKEDGKIVLKNKEE